MKKTTIFKRSGTRKVTGKKAAFSAAAVIAAVLLLFFLSGIFLINYSLNRIHYDPETKSPVPFIRTDSDSRTAPESSQNQSGAPGSLVEKQLLEDAASLPENQNVFNLLLIGSDSRVPGQRGRSDTMILVSINRRTRRVAFTSFLRDIYLRIPGIWQENRLNAANAFGGPSLLLETIRRNFQVQVDHYISVDFSSFMKFIDRIGGVEIDVTDDEIAAANEYVRNINLWYGIAENDGVLCSAGKQLLNGKQALSYARIRSIGSGDFDRTDRQRAILRKALEKLKTQSLLESASLLNTFLPDITTNLSKGELLSLLLLLPSYPNYKVESCHIPINGTFSCQNVRGMSVLKIDLSKNVAEIQKQISG
ncbi:LCP family protein [Caproicibacter fermentans]|uniref:LCP family protein n=1 Tax=Caproicibacter fermentans TaxID=2576756 RepID=A0A7G8TB49_9FIRM|nr:LCP family protein [Caproicibacter fermentans]QNK40840.1 LCP family protein [Caproicibacter fermentans]